LVAEEDYSTEAGSEAGLEFPAYSEEAAQLRLGQVCDLPAPLIDNIPL
jgi:hypothetical protein